MGAETCKPVLRIDLGDEAFPRTPVDGPRGPESAVRSATASRPLRPAGPAALAGLWARAAPAAAVPVPQIPGRSGSGISMSGVGQSRQSPPDTAGSSASLSCRVGLSNCRLWFSGRRACRSRFQHSAPLHVPANNVSLGGRVPPRLPPLPEDPPALHDALPERLTPSCLRTETPRNETPNPPAGHRRPRPPEPCFPPSSPTAGLPCRPGGRLTELRPMCPMY